jgi:hypothetical protein
VTCYVDCRGDFVDLGFRSDWWYTAGPSGIASATLDALAFAQEKSVVAAVILGRHGRLIEEMGPNPFAFLQSGRVARMADEIAEADGKIRRTAAMVDAADRIGRMRDSAQQRIVTGPRGLFRLTMAGFALQRADVDRSALSMSHTDLLAEDARAALAQATREKDPRYWFCGEVIA